MKKLIRATSEFHKIDGYHLTRNLFDRLKQSLPKNCSPKDLSNHYGYQIELENVPSFDKLVRVVGECLNAMGYTVFFDIDEVESFSNAKSTVLAAVDESNDSWAQLVLTRFEPDHDALVAIDTDQGNVILEDWYESDQ